jgi:DNA polymerase-3 subunit delta'
MRILEGRCESMRETVSPTTTPIDPRRTVTLDRFLGNEPVRAYLLRAWRRRQLPQALLISGPEGIGKTTLAWGLIRQIVAGDGDPATDPHALKVERGVHPDVIELTGKDSASSMILVGDVRAIEDRAWTAPLEAPRKVVLIAPADRMNESAANCLLKLLEEPPPNLVFLLVTSEPGRLLDTIRSRCASMPLEPVALEELASWLRERKHLDEERARLVAMLAEGRPGRALRLCEAGVLGRREALLQSLALLRAEGFAVLFQVADRFLDSEDDLSETLLMAMALLRDALTLKVRDEGLLNVDLREPLAALAQRCPDAGLLEAARRFEAAAHEAPYCYTPQARAHFVEVLLGDVGRMMRG